MVHDQIVSKLRKADEIEAELAQCNERLKANRERLKQNRVELGKQNGN
jgi:hypothetical protein